MDQEGAGLFTDPLRQGRIQTIINLSSMMNELTKLSLRGVKRRGNLVTLLHYFRDDNL